jgi:hypothetical protein
MEIAAESVQAVPLPAATVDESNASEDSINAVEMYHGMYAPEEYGSGVSSAKHRVLFERICAVLSNAVAHVPIGGVTGCVQASTFTTRFEFADWHPTPCSIFAVWW